MTNLNVNITPAISETGGTGSEGETSNEVIVANAVYANNGMLYVKAAQAELLSVYTVTGQLAKKVTVSGEATFSLPKGIYIVTLANKAYKVVL